MVTLDRASFQTQPRYATYVGLAEDTKPTGSLVNNGDEFQEIDTGKTYKFSDTDHQWYEQPEGGVSDEYLPLSGGTMEPNAEINAQNNLLITGKDADGSYVRMWVAQNPLFIGFDAFNQNLGRSTGMQINPNVIRIDGLNGSIRIDDGFCSFDNMELANVKSIGGYYLNPDIKINKTFNMDYHKITNLSSPDDDGDAMNKGTADATYVSKTQFATESNAGIVKQAVNVSDSSGATDVVLEEKFNALLASLREAGILATQ